MIFDLSKPDSKALREVMPEFDFENPIMDVQELTTSLLETMYHYNGVGLSANQCERPIKVMSDVVNVPIRARVFAMRGTTPFVCFNPRIVYADPEVIEMEEACLTFPGIVVKRTRPKHIRVRFATPSGIVTTHTFTGLSARVFQHECDHLDGKVFFEGVGRLTMNRALKKASKLGFDYIGLMKDAVS